MMRTAVHSRKFCTVWLEAVLHIIINTLHIFHGEQAAGYAGLICYHNREPSLCTETGQSLGDALYPAYLFRRMQEIDFFYERSVPVQK